MKVYVLISAKLEDRNYTVSQKNDTDVTHYRFNPHPPKKFKGQHVKFGLKFRVRAPITLRLVGVTSPKLFRATCRKAGVFNWAQFLGKARP